MPARPAGLRKAMLLSTVEQEAAVFPILWYPVREAWAASVLLLPPRNGSRAVLRSHFSFVGSGQHGLQRYPPHHRKPGKILDNPTPADIK